MNLGIDWQKHSALVLLAGSIAFSVLSIALNVVSPTDTTVYNVVLTAILIIVGLVALVLAARNEALAVQLFWWSVLAVIGGMVAVDNHQTGVFPVILYVPPVAAVAVRVLSGFKAALVYCVGVFALMIPSGIAYDRLGWATMVVGVVALVITVDWIMGRHDRLQLDVLMAVLYAREASARKALDEINT